MQIMREHRIDIMAIQEPKVSTSSEETKVQEKTGDKFKFIFSSNAQEQHPRSVQINRPGRHANTKSKAKAKAANKVIEHHGVGFVIGPKLIDHVKDCNPAQQQVHRSFIGQPRPRYLFCKPLRTTQWQTIGGKNAALGHAAGYCACPREASSDIYLGRRKRQVTRQYKPNRRSSYGQICFWIRLTTCPRPPRRAARQPSIS